MSNRMDKEPVLTKRMTGKKESEEKGIRLSNEKADILSSNENLLLFNNVPIAVLITTAKGKLIKANSIASKMFGYTEKELELLNMYELYQDVEDRKKLVDSFKKTKSIKDFETKFIHKDGKILNVIINSDFIDFNDEKILLNSIQDVTHYVESQKKITIGGRTLS